MDNHTENTSLTQVPESGISLAPQGVEYWWNFYRKGMENQGSIQSDVRGNECHKCGDKFIKKYDEDFELTVPRCKSCNASPNKLRVCFTVPTSTGDFKRITQRYDFDNNKFTKLHQAVAYLDSIQTKLGDKTLDVTKVGSKKTQKAFSVSGFVDAYLTRKRRLVGSKGASTGYVKGIASLKEHYLDPYFGDMHIAEVKYMHLDDFLYNWVPNTESGKANSRSHSRALELLRKVMKEARKTMPDLVVPEFPEMQTSKETKLRITREEQLKILDHVNNHTAAIGFCIYYPVRPCEARALKWKDLDFENRVITIQRHITTCEKGKGQYGSNKTMHLQAGRKSATDPNDPYFSIQLAMTEDFVRLIKDHIAIPSINPEAFVFGTNPDTPLYETALRKEWNKACDRAKLPRVKFYVGTKHSTANYLLNDRKVHKDQLRAILGHTDARTTEKYATNDSLVASQDAFK